MIRKWPSHCIYCWKAQHLLSKKMDNIELYPEKTIVMTRSNKVSHKMTIIRKITMPREYSEVTLTACLLYNYGQVIYCVKDQFLPVKIRYDVKLRGERVCLE